MVVFFLLTLNLSEIAVLGLIFTTGAGLAWLDIVDNFINSYTLIVTGILEVIAVGWCFKTSKVLDAINRNTNKFKMPALLFKVSIKFISPVVLTLLFVWNVVTLISGGGIYGAADGYSLTANIIGGWLVMALSLVSGFVVKLIVRTKSKKGYVEETADWNQIDKV